MVHAKGALAQHDRLDALVGAMAYYVEHMARDTHLAALDTKPESSTSGLRSSSSMRWASMAHRPGGSLPLSCTVETKDPRCREQKGSPLPPWAALIICKPQPWEVSYRVDPSDGAVRLEDDL